MSNALRTIRRNMVHNIMKKKGYRKINKKNWFARNWRNF